MVLLMNSRKEVYISIENKARGDTCLMVIVDVVDLLWGNQDPGKGILPAGDSN